MFASNWLECIRWDRVCTTYRTLSCILTRFLVGPLTQCLGVSGFFVLKFSSISNHAGFRNEKVVIQKSSFHPISHYHIFVRGSSFLAYRGFFLIFFGFSCKKMKFGGSQLKKGGELPSKIPKSLASCGTSEPANRLFVFWSNNKMCGESPQNRRNIMKNLIALLIMSAGFATMAQNVNFYNSNGSSAGTTRWWSKCSDGWS